jgi:hypothetical protein
VKTNQETKSSVESKQELLGQFSSTVEQKLYNLKLKSKEKQNKG